MAKAKYLYDDFSTTIAVSGKWTTSNAVTGVVTGGQMRIKPTTSYDTVTAVSRVDLVGSHLGFKLVQNCIKGAGTNTIMLGAYVNGTNSVSLWIEGGRTLANAATVYMRETVAGVSSDTTFTYDPAVHVWFRIREASGTVYWDTSTDGSTWTNRRAKSTSLTLTSVLVTLEGGYWGAEAGTTFATIDDFNLWAGAPGIPKMEEFTDDFSSEGSNWYFPHDVAGAFAVSGGQLTASPSYDYPGLTSTTTWDLTNSFLAVRMVQNANRGTSEYNSITTEFYAWLDTNNKFGFVFDGGVSGGRVVLKYVLAGVVMDSVSSFDTSKDKWFRIRSVGTTIYWETSFDSVTWTIKRALTTTMPLTALKARFVTGAWDTAESDPGTVIFDDLNLVNTTRLKEIGWTVGLALPMGGKPAGTVQKRVFLEEASWLWDEIPTSPVLDPDSDEIGFYLTGAGDAVHGSSVSWGWYGNAIVLPSQVLETTPRYQMIIVGQILHPDWNLNEFLFDDYRIPIPYGTQVPPGSDSHLVVADPVSGKVFSFWQAHYNPEADTWTASYGGISELHGDGRDFGGTATATNLCRLAGVIRLGELEAGEIPHALFVASNMCRPGEGWVSPDEPGSNPPFVYPAQKSDGRNLASVPLQYTVVEGTRLQLDPALDLESVPDITPIELTIGRAWQRYGAYVGDQGGNPWPPTVGAGQIELWQGQDYTSYNEALNPDIPVPPLLAALGVEWDYFALDHIPWEGNIRVLKNWDGSA